MTLPRGWRIIDDGTQWQVQEPGGGKTPWYTRAYHIERNSLVRRLPERIGAPLSADVLAALQALPAVHPGEQLVQPAASSPSAGASSSAGRVRRAPEPDPDGERAAAVGLLSPTGQAAYRDLSAKALLDTQRIKELAAHPQEQQAFLLGIVIADLLAHEQAKAFKAGREFAYSPKKRKPVPRAAE